MPIEYRNEVTDGDLGTALPDSILPIENGEPVEETYLNRAPWNLQNRTEKVRQSVDSLQQIVLGNHGLTLTSSADAKIIFHDMTGGYFRFYLNNTGTVATSNRDLVIFPLLSLANNAVGSPLYPKFYFSYLGSEFSLTSRFKVCDGGHNILVRFYKVTGQETVAVSIEGALYPTMPGTIANEIKLRPVTIAVQVKDTVTTLPSEIVAAIAANTVSDALVSGTTVLDNAFTIYTPTPKRLYAGNTGSQAGIDNEGILISAATIESFFGGTPATRLFTEGSVLVIDCLSAALRKSKTLSVSLGVSNLAMLREGGTVSEQNLGDADSGVFPIAKMYDGRLYLLNGAVLTQEVPQNLDNTQAIFNLAVGNTVTTSLVPSVNTLNLGSSGTHWGSLYVNAFGNNIASHIIPTATTYDLGSAANHWGNVYVNAIIGGSGTSSFDTLQINNTFYSGNGTGDTSQFVGNVLCTDPTFVQKYFKLDGATGHIGINGDPDTSAWLTVSGLTKLASETWLIKSDAKSDEKNWEWRVTGTASPAVSGTIELKTLTDLGGAGNTAIGILRNGTALTSITFGADIVPTGSVTLGTSSDRWSNAFLTALNMDTSQFTLASGAGSGTIVMVGASPVNSAGFFTVTFGGTPYYIPVFAATS